MAFERTVEIFSPECRRVAVYRLRRTAWKDAAWWCDELGEHLPVDKVAHSGAVLRVTAAAEGMTLVV